MTTENTLDAPSQPESERKIRTVPPPTSTFFCRAVFAALGLLMLAAAGFKAYEAYGHPMSIPELAGSMALVCFEILFGAWLLFGVGSAWTLRVAATSFATFACVSAYKALTGASSCGCFGTLQVDPAISLVIDLAAVGLLLRCRAGVEEFSKSKLQQVLPTVAAFATMLSAIAISVPLYRQVQFAHSDSSAHSDSTETTIGELVVLDSESWAGMRWPLLGEAGLPRRLEFGEWNVLLFRHDCHVCHDVMREIESILSTQGERQKIALIGVDEPRVDAQTARLQKLGCVLSYLPQDREWFATTPLRVRLSDGVCVSASVVNSWEQQERR